MASDRPGPQAEPGTGPVAAFDFDGHALEMGGGSFGQDGATLSASIVLPPTHPSNPFYHRFHPQHDQNCGCDDLYTPGTQDHQGCLDVCSESYRVEREIDVTFTGTDPQSPASPRPDWGVTRVAGTYAETLTGLHRVPLAVAGDLAASAASQLLTATGWLIAIL